MRKYSLCYHCENCGCKTLAEFNWGILAPDTIECDNCGCTAYKDKPGKPNCPVPYYPYYPYSPWAEHIPRWEKPKEPWQFICIADWHVPVIRGHKHIAYDSAGATS